MLNAAVIGCGAMGRNHLRVLSELPGVHLIAAADQDAERLESLARRFQVQIFASHTDLLQHTQPHFAVVAVPTREHADVVSDLIKAGVHTLVEKPIAATVAEASALAKAATQANVLLAVGHVERFNPAIIELKRRLEAGELGRVFQAQVRRLGPFPARVRDVGVVLDLATHDLDVLRYLIGADVTRVSAETERRIHTAHEDLLSALLRFTNGVIASLDINWLTPTKVRKLYLTGERGMFVVDYLLQELTFHANDHAISRWEALEALTGVSEGSMIRYKLEKREPLQIELVTFAAAVATRLGVDGGQLPVIPGPGIVTAQDGLEALRLAALIVEAGKAGSTLDGTAPVNGQESGGPA